LEPTRRFALVALIFVFGTYGLAQPFFQLVILTVPIFLRLL
jgi:hypothetical protein